MTPRAGLQFGLSSRIPRHPRANHTTARITPAKTMTSPSDTVRSFWDIFMTQAPCSSVGALARVAVEVAAAETASAALLQALQRTIAERIQRRRRGYTHGRALRERSIDHGRLRRLR